MNQRSSRAASRRIVLLLAFLFGAATAWAREPVLSFEGREVSVAGATPSGRVALFGVARWQRGFVGAMGRFSDLLTADEMGAATFEAPIEVPVSSVWAVVDLETGTATLQVPPDGVLQTVPFPSRAIGQARRWIEDRRQFLEFLLVRPGGAGGNGGAWALTAAEGSELDDDGASNGNLRVLLEDFFPMEEDGPPPPDELEGGDVLVVVDRFTLEVFSLVVPGQG